MAPANTFTSVLSATTTFTEDTWNARHYRDKTHDEANAVIPSSEVPAVAKYTQTIQKDTRTTVLLNCHSSLTET